MLLERLCVLPLDTELNEEGASGEPAERIRDNPERNECSNEEDENTGSERETKLGEG